MHSLSRDTHLDAERVQMELLRRASPARKFALTQSMTSAVLALQRRALYESHPEASEREIRQLALGLNYGEQVARSVRESLEARGG